MVRRMKLPWLLGGVVSLATVACGDDHLERPAGTKGCPCYPNDTCKAALACERGSWVEAPDGGMDESGGAGGMEGSSLSGGRVGAGGQAHAGGSGAAVSRNRCAEPALAAVVRRRT